MTDPTDDAPAFPGGPDVPVPAETAGSAADAGGTAPASAAAAAATETAADRPPPPRSPGPAGGTA